MESWKLNAFVVPSWGDDTYPFTSSGKVPASSAAKGEGKKEGKKERRKEGKKERRKEGKKKNTPHLLLSSTLVARVVLNRGFVDRSKLD
jgi:hypothetical protein